MQISRLLSRSKILIFLIIEVGTNDHIGCINNSYWARLDDKCHGSIPVDISLLSYKPLSSSQNYVTVQSLDVRGDSDIDFTICTRFKRDFLRKARLIDLFYRRTNAPTSGNFPKCTAFCENLQGQANLVKNDDSVHNLPDYCKFSRILVIEPKLFREMGKPELLNHKIDLSIHLMSLESINNSQFKHQVPRIEAYLDLFDDTRDKFEVRTACEELFKKIDDSKFVNSSASKESETKKKIPLVIGCCCAGFVLLVIVIVATIYIYRRKNGVNYITGKETKDNHYI